MKYVNRKRRYFRKQKLMGLALALLGVLSAFILEGDITVAILLVPFGLYVVFTKEMLWMDDYYYECKYRKSVSNRRP